MIAIGVSPFTGMIGAIGVGIAFAFGGAANSVHNVTVRADLQRAAPADSLGRTAALYVAVTRGATIIGFVLGGLLIPDEAPTAYLIGGIASVTADGVGWSIFRRG